MATEVTDRIIAHDDSGQIYTIEMHSNIVMADGMSMRHCVGRGASSLRLSDGRTVNKIDENTFEIFSSGVRRHRSI